MADKEYALIVAGGRGTRFGSTDRKQFTDLAGRPVIVHTLQAFVTYSPAIDIVLVLPEQDLSYWPQLASRHGFDRSVTLAAGGATRFESVRNGLEKIGDEGYVAIHDGVRPLVAPEIIKASFDMAKVHLAAVAAVKPKDSVRIIGEEGGKPRNRSANREGVRLIQTPQTFQCSLIRRAYAEAWGKTPQATDDAGVAEAAGYAVHLFEGSYENLKITTPEDLYVAEAILTWRAKP